MDHKLLTDLQYDNRKKLSDSEVLRAEVLEILTHYSRPEDFWTDYRLVLQKDPATPADLKRLNLPAFEKFLKHHVDETFSAPARQNRFNNLFLEAHDVFISRDRENYISILLNIPKK